MLQKLGSAFTSALVWLLALIIAVPLFNTLLSGFKTSREINRSQFWPTKFQLDNFQRALAEPSVTFSFVNTLILAVGGIGLSLVLCSVASYGLARRKGRIFSVLYIVFLAAMIVPAVAALIPLYTMMRVSGLMDTHVGLILIYGAAGIPFGVLMFTSFIKAVPVTLDEAAILEGCSYRQRFFRIIFPLVQPVTVSFSALQVPTIWNDFLMPLLFLRSKMNRTITLSVYTFTREHEVDIGAVFALLILALIPPMLFFAFAQKQLYRGITAGGVKG